MPNIIGNCTLTEATRWITALSKEVYVSNNIAEITVDGTSYIIVKDTTMEELVKQRHDGFNILDYIRTIKPNYKIQTGESLIDLCLCLCSETSLYKLNQQVDIAEMIALYKKEKERNFSFTYCTHKI